MNRATALLLAMAALLAHALAVHLEPGGRLGQPYEEAHAAFRLARNLVREGALVWNPAEAPGSGARGGLGAHASPLLVAVSAVAERLYLPVNRFAQLAGVLAALLTVSASARFATDRSAGIIPALLLVTSGAFAAVAVSGTELPLTAFALTLAFVARERRRPLLFAAGCALLVSCRVEGLIVAAVLALLVGAERARAPGPLGRTPWWTLLPAAALAAALVAVDDGHGRPLYATRLAALWPDGARLAEGGRYLFDFLVTSVTPLLLVFPLVALLGRGLSGAGTRALLLGLVWTLLIVAEGGGPTPFAAALVPALPLMFLAVQHGIITALDSRRWGLERLAWTALLVGALASALASKSPGALALQRTWLEQASAAPHLGDRALRGRPALEQELVKTADLRSLGRFLKEQVDPGLSILTPWTGALGYLSGRTVLDLFGRVTAAPGDPSRSAWPARGSFDLIAALEQGADLVLPERIGARALTGQRRGGPALDLAWLEFDSVPLARERAFRLGSALAAYELVTVPVAEERDRRPVSGRAVFLLRRRDLALAPQLDLHLEQGAIVVAALPPQGEGIGHPQLVQLRVTAIDEQGATWSVDPRGHLVDDDRIVTRPELVLGLGEAARVELFRGALDATPAGSALVEVQARLINARLHGEHPLAPASALVVLPLR